MKTVAITGASGVVGRRALAHILDRDDVGHVVALGRRPLQSSHGKLASRVVDLQDVEGLAHVLPDTVDIAVCCLGTTMKQAGSQEAFRAVDHEAVLAFARAARQKKASRFVLVSAIGANARARNFYLRTKGEAEQALAQLGYPHLCILRPSFIDDEGARGERRILEQLGLPLSRALFSFIGKTHRYAPISAEDIAKALVRLAFEEPQDRVRIAESDHLHALAR